MNKEYIFNSNEYIELYLSFIKRESINYNLSILAYCIMNNHAHFLIHVDEIEELGAFMHDVNYAYAKTYNYKEKRCGVLFRNRYHVEPIYEERYLINCIHYIHMNPVKAKIVTKCDEYQYSSYQYYLTNSGITNSPILIELFGKNCDYLKMFKTCNERIFDDVDNDKEKKQCLEAGMVYFAKSKVVNLCDIFSKRDIFKKLIEFLYKDCGLKYVDISRYFDIPRGVMQKLKK